MTAPVLSIVHLLGANTHEVGCHSEAMVLARLIGKGWNVLVPFSRVSRYDFAIEKEGTFYRIQVKTGRLDSRRDGAISFPTVSSYAHRGRKPVGYIGDVDAFGVYCPENDSVYLVPTLEIAACVRECFLRVRPSRNNQKKGVRWAGQYLIG